MEVKNPLSSWISSGVWFLFCMIALCWPAIINGQPFFHPDTSSYIRGFDYAVQRFFSAHTEWSLAGTMDPSYLITERNLTKVGLNSPDLGFVISGRSVYYGAFLYICHIIESLWLATFGQAAVVVTAIHFLCRRFHQNSPVGATIIVVLVLSLLTTVPFSVSFLMPDVFAGLSILGIGYLSLFGAEVRLNEGIFWAPLLTFAAASHASILLLMSILVFIAGLSVMRIRGIKHLYCLRLALVAVLVGVVAEIFFNIVVERVIGAPPIRPPFLMARVIEDGPGYSYLKDSCPASKFSVCASLNELPLPAAGFLWSKVFLQADPATRRALSNEQTRFVINTIAYDPLGQLLASTRNWFKQLTRFDLGEVNYTPENKSGYANKLPTTYFTQLKETISYKANWPISVMTLVHSLVVLSSALYLSFVFIWNQATDAPTRAFRLLSFIIVSGVIANAFICGVLSDPVGRYQARVIWLLPLLALGRILFLMYAELNFRRMPFQSLSASTLGSSPFIRQGRHGASNSPYQIPRSDDHPVQQIDNPE